MRNTKEFGQLIKQVRKKSKLTQAQVAAAANVGERFVRELEKGKATCQIEKAFRIAQLLGIRFEVTLPFKNNE